MKSALMSTYHRKPSLQHKHFRLPNIIVLKSYSLSKKPDFLMHIIKKYHNCLQF